MEPSSHNFHHPYDPYRIQLDFMQRLYQCIENRNVGVFESPTGTGKSLSLICAALTWLRDNERRRFYGSTEDDAESDWLSRAEKKNQRDQLLETRREVESKLKDIRRKNAQEEERKHSAKRVKKDEEFREQDLLLEDYESDGEPAKRENSLSVATLALLRECEPAKSVSEPDLKEDKTQIIFCSRTHSQLTQFVNELRKVSLPPIVPEAADEEIIKHIPLGSRKNLCINTKVSRLHSTIAINERCLELQKPGLSQDQKCEFFPHKNSHSDRERIELFKDSAIAQILDIEDIGRLGRKMKLCPYYASRSAISAAEILTLPYPLLLQKTAREALGVAIEDNVVIIDEAHNIISAIADTLSVSMPLSHLELAQSQLLGYSRKFNKQLKGQNRNYIAQIIKLLRSCIVRLLAAQTSSTAEISLSANDLISGANDQIQPHKLIKYIQQSKLIFKVEGYAEILDQQTQSGSKLDRKSTSPQPKGVLAEFQNLLVALMNPATEGRFFVRRVDGEIVLKYTLLDPQAHFEEIVSEARSVILAGGTMSPMGDWPDQLFPYLKPERLRAYSFGHIIDKSNVLVRPLAQGPNNVEFDFTFANRRSERMVLELGAVIERLSAIIPDGVVVFFPSYEYLAQVSSLWQKPQGSSSPHARISQMKKIYQESKESDVDGLLKDYTKQVNDGWGAVMLAVVGGKLSEGINFSDKLGRAVFCVGLPYPNIQSAEWKEKVSYMERQSYRKAIREGLSDLHCQIRAQAAGKEFADNTTMRAVNQSIGRAIRHKNDFAAIFLVDKRYSASRIQEKLPTWLKEGLSQSQHTWPTIEDNCRSFFTRN